MTKRSPRTAIDPHHAYGGLHVLVDDGTQWAHTPAAQAELACRGGARVIQLRCKHVTDAEILTLGREIRAVTRRYGARFVMNDRFDLALASEADCVHLGQGDLPPLKIPARLRERLAIGRSTHTLAQLREACTEPLAYVAFGPIFETTSKASPYEARGLALLAQACALAKPLPLIAIGGIQRERLAEVRAAGASGFAVIGAVAGAEDPEAATRDLLAVWKESSRAPHSP